ncbi:MAG: hypothetical protein ACP5TZ_06085 [Nitrososphaeria archaeon]
MKFTCGLSHIGAADVFQLHRDSFLMSAGAELLAYSDKYFQAFRYGKAVGLQFHPEVTAEMLKMWRFKSKFESKKLNGLILDYWLGL